MRWVADTSGRFQWRPYYEPEELDAECEQIVCSFLEAKNGAVRFPVSTDDLSVMVEQDTSDLDLYADLAGMGEDVEGVTDFFSKRKPAVRIARELSWDESKRHRLRATLAHEFGHVRFHKFLWDSALPHVPKRSLAQQLSSQRARYRSLRGTLGTGSGAGDGRPLSVSLTAPPRNHRPGPGPRCRRTSMFDAPVSDWMEWQASYVCGAILMPSSSVRSLVRSGMGGLPLPGDSEQAGELAASVASAFDVSTTAALDRLAKLGVLRQQGPAAG